MLKQRGVQLLASIFTAVLLIGLAPHAFAEKAAFATEQFKINTEDAAPVKPGDFEFEFAYGLAASRNQFDNRGGHLERGSLREHTYDLKLAAGVVDGVEMNTGIGYVDLFDKEAGPSSHGRGWSDIEIGAKIRLFNSSKHEMTFTWAPSVIIPSGRESREDRLGPGGASTVFNNKLIMSKNWGRWNVNLDSGYGLPAGNRQDSRGTWDTNAALGYQMLSWLQPAIEFHYAHDFVRSESDADYFAMTGGLIMPVHERLRIGAGVQQGLAGRNTDQTTAVSIVATIFV